MLFVASVLLNLRGAKIKIFDAFNNSLQIFLTKSFPAHVLIYCGSCVRERYILPHNLQVASKLKYPACKVMLNQNEDSVWSSLDYSVSGNSPWMAVKPICFPNRRAGQMSNRCGTSIPKVPKASVPIVWTIIISTCTLFFSWKLVLKEGWYLQIVQGQMTVSAKRQQMSCNQALFKTAAPI